MKIDQNSRFRGGSVISAREDYGVILVVMMATMAM